MTRTTVAFDERLFRALKLKSALTTRSLSEIVSEAVRQSLREDALDLASFEERKAEPSRPFEKVLSELKRDGLI